MQPDLSALPAEFEERGAMSGAARVVPWQRRVEWTLLGLGVVVYWAMRHNIDGDAAVRYDTLTRLLESGKLSDSRYSVVQQLATIPLYVIGKHAGGSYLFVEYFNALVFFGGLATLFGLLRNRLDADVLRRLLLLLTAASMFPYHAQNYYGEIFSVVMVSVALALYGLDRFVAGTAAVVLGVVNAPVTVGALALVAAREAWQSRRWVRWAIPVVAAAALIVLEGWIRRGTPLHTGYEGDAGARTVLPYSARPGFSYPLFLGVISQLLSFGKGIAFFAPGLWLAFAQREPFSPAVERLYRASGVFLCGLILVYAKWWSWYGGWYWGPRFLLFAALPSSLLLALHLSRSTARRSTRVATVGILWLSVWVAASGAVFGQGGQGVCQQNNYALESMCWYVPEFSPLILPFIAHRVLGLRDRLLLAYFVSVGAWLAFPIVKDLVIESLSPLRAGTRVRQMGQ